LEKDESPETDESSESSETRLVHLAVLTGQQQMSISSHAGDQANEDGLR